MGWNAGYVSETTYTMGYYEGMNPHNLNLHLLFRGKRPIDLQRSFNYCELACGRGLTTNMLAVMYPQGNFYANDFNPDHIAFCRSFAEKIGVNNVTFSDASFVEYDDDPTLPSEFDFICLHGIYSWISAENQKAIINFIRQRLKVGGVVYISYNAMPGWAQVLPMQRFLLAQGRDKTGTIYERFQYAFEKAKRFESSGSQYFNQEMVKIRLNQLSQHNPSYLVHEYFNEHWKALYFDEVQSHLSDAKLTFLGQARLGKLIEQMEVNPAGLELLSEFTDPIKREQAKDFLLNTQFREDLYIKGSNELSPEENVQLISQLHLYLTLPLSRYKSQFPTQAGLVELPETFLEVLKLCANAKESLSIGAIAEKLGLSILDVARIAVIMAGFSFLTIYNKTEWNNAEQRKLYNHLALGNPGLNQLICPTTNHVIWVDILHKMFILEKSPEDILLILNSLGMSMSTSEKIKENDEEKVVHRKATDEEALSMIQKSRKEYESEWMGIYRGLGF